MAKECFEKCPRIQAIRQRMVDSAIWEPSVFGGYPPLNGNNEEALAVARQAAEGCPGPTKDKVIYVRKSLLDGTKVPKIVWGCGLDQKASTDDVPQTSEIASQWEVARDKVKGSPLAEFKGRLPI